MPLEAAEPAPQMAMAAGEFQADSDNDAWEAMLRAQTVLTRGVEEMTLTLSGLTRMGIAATADAAIALLAARSFAEAVEINAGLMRRNADAMIEGVAKLSEIGAKAAQEAARPVLSRFGADWLGIG